MGAPIEAAKRYSDTRLNDSFTAYLLLSEPIQFQFEEIWQAVSEDFPELQWAFEVAVAPPFDSSTVSMGTYFGTKAQGDAAHHGLISFLSTPGRIGIDLQDAITKSRFAFPEAKQVVDQHRSCVSISVSSVDSTIPARFDAARRMNALVAVFAKLPICLGAYFPSADIILAPNRWVESAETSRKGSFPAMQWINYIIAPSAEGKVLAAEGDGRFTIFTIGCAAFNGHEFVLPSVRMDRVEALGYVYSAVTMVLEHGHEFRDGNTMGDEEQRLKIRIRHCPEGTQGAQTDQWVLFHPSSSLDDIRMFGEREGQPPPPGYDNGIRGDQGWLRKSLRLFSSPRGSRPS
jgi:hypothetical protein